MFNNTRELLRLYMIAIYIAAPHGSVQTLGIVGHGRGYLSGAEPLE